MRQHDGVHLCMRQVEAAAQRVAQLVVQRHGNAAKHRATEPGAVERIGAGLLVAAVGMDGDGLGLAGGLPGLGGAAPAAGPAAGRLPAGARRAGCGRGGGGCAACGGSACREACGRGTGGCECATVHGGDAWDQVGAQSDWGVAFPDRISAQVKLPVKGKKRGLPTQASFFVWVVQIRATLLRKGGGE